MVFVCVLSRVMNCLDHAVIVLTAVFQLLYVEFFSIQVSLQHHRYSESRFSIVDNVFDGNIFLSSPVRECTYLANSTYTSLTKN